MADTMQFDLVSPERNLVSVPVREVRLPGAEGDLTRVQLFADFVEKGGC